MNDKINVEMFINLHSFYKNYVALILAKLIIMLLQARFLHTLYYIDNNDLKY